MFWTVHLDEDAGHAAAEADEWLVGYYGLPRYWGDSWGPWGSARVLRERIAELADAGAAIRGPLRRLGHPRSARTLHARGLATLPVINSTR